MTKSNASLLCQDQNPSSIRKGKCVKLLKKLNGDLKKANNPRKPRTALSLLIDNNVVLPMAKVYYRNKAGVLLKKGRITRDGIVCDCCLKNFALTAFETHAGSTYHRPAAFIMLDDGSGRSLSDCHKQVDGSNTFKKVSKVQIKGQYNSSCGSESPDLVCSVCGNEEELIVCQQCPAAFHLKCVGLKQMKTKSSEYWKNCHTGNVNWFCSHSCENIFYGLEKLIGNPIQVEENLSWTLLKKSNNGDSDHHDDKKKLSAAVDVMHECFETSKDFYTGRDVAEDVIFGRESKLKRVDFKGFYTVILEEKGDVATVATVRVHDKRVAELPLAATKFSHRRRGMCRVLVDELEKQLRELMVERLVLPAVPSALETWTKLGFSKMRDEDKSSLLQNYTLLDFQGTIMCQKILKTHSPW
ncbi:hypothetical protein COLO4_29902 [Corchorus olitorius]|uniref:N-acetyltransferase domain-containing protein n=1 Tax=Corchorus olitorius TaxID=93759 RepID=A0A1R3HCM0_9ROSI|nr:hypothetical protein COLO4_29902 [Corchorus olitorius]